MIPPCDIDNKTSAAIDRPPRGSICDIVNKVSMRRPAPHVAPLILPSQEISAAFRRSVLFHRPLLCHQSPQGTGHRCDSPLDRGTRSCLVELVLFKGFKSRALICTRYFYSPHFSVSREFSFNESLNCLLHFG